MEPSMQIRKRADKSNGERISMVDQATGQRKLVNPDTPGEDHEPWPLAGVDYIGELPDEMNLATKFVARAISEGWLEGELIEMVHRPGGPPDNQWAVTHSFPHYSTLTFHFTTGDEVYKVTHQPDKYTAEGTDKTKVTDQIYAAGATRVDSFYTCKLTGKKG